MEWLFLERWSPYAAGIGIGVLSWLTFLLSDKALGCSTAFARTSGMAARLFRGKKVLQNPYYRKFAPQIDWEWMLVLGVILGAYISARLSGTFDWRWVPPLWEQTFGGAVWVRVAVAFLGGVFMGFGSRWAGGCTSGHGISGTLQLSVSSWITVVFFFAGGIGAAMILFRVIGG
ncbi:MAG: YeeE/YedE family protein [Candidatus Aminicenantes bacterium]|nr:YeeE/YedE family protein [Candidatus Aminicenantes bacterium]